MNKHLRLEKQIKKQGFPRIIQKIQKAVDQLIEVKIFETASIEEIDGKKDYLISWQCSDKYIKHQDLKRRKSA